jgi:hypothetical protein
MVAVVRHRVIHETVTVVILEDDPASSLDGRPANLSCLDLAEESTGHPLLIVSVLDLEPIRVVASDEDHDASAS